MAKQFKWLLLLLIPLLSLTFTSCGDDDDEPDDSDLVGTWVCKNFDIWEDEVVSFTMCFKSNGTGWMEWSDEDEHYKFVYSVSNGTIYFTDEYDYWQCDYVINGKKLTIYGNPWGEEDDINVVTLTRK